MCYKVVCNTGKRRCRCHCCCAARKMHTAYRQCIGFCGTALTSCTRRFQVISITDGEPAGEPNNTILQVIKGAKNLCANSPYGPGAIAFQIAQVRVPAPMQATCLWESMT